MAYTQTELDLLRQAYATGVRDVWIGNRRVTYSTAEDMERRIAQLERAVNPTTNITRIKMTGSKGL